ncbi:coiled-coil domain-containing protein 112-like [Stylophora pistillata]|uniref:coiled-coil domain-containing protein 112-like n=1 Tax=Stylophora pistillata TaxID=50429 RepID=UPI000C04E429|nr:coiled-coil domain-containing protein 112-like [Stylophora pistillata]
MPMVLLIKVEKAEALSELEEKKEDIEKLREKLSVRKEEVKKLKEDTTRENDHQQRVVTSQDIQKIVDDVDDITRDLVASLRMPTPLGRNIEEEKTKKRDRIWEVLIKWKYSKGYRATLSTLKDVLLKLNQTKAAIKLSEMEELNEDVKHARAQSAKLRDDCDQLKEDLEKKSEELKNCSKELKQSRRAAKEMKTKKRIYVRAQSARSRNKLHQFNDNLEEEQRGHKTAGKKIEKCENKLA